MQWRAQSHTFLSGLRKSRFELLESRWLLSADPFESDTSDSEVLDDQTDVVEVESATSAEPLLAFPGAEGFGANSVGGRGGKVYEVTHLGDDGEGSLRECVKASGRRTCVFRVGGTIEVKSRMSIRDPYLTIAGQTAPGGGITLRNHDSYGGAPISLGTHDIIIRYIRFRPGNPGPDGGDLEQLTFIRDAKSCK